MTTDAYLWAIFALLSLALVLVVVTARRGQWERQITTGAHTFQKGDEGVPMHGSGLPEGAYIYRIDSPTRVTLRQRHRLRRRIKRLVRTHRSHIYEPPDVDPLWGKNRPGAVSVDPDAPARRSTAITVADLMKDEW